MWNSTFDLGLRLVNGLHNLLVRLRVTYMELPMGRDFYSICCIREEYLCDVTRCWRLCSETKSTHLTNSKKEIFLGFLQVETNGIHAILRFKQLLLIIVFFSFAIFSLRIKVIGLVLNITNLHYCQSRHRMKFGILGPKDRFVQDMCQQETFHHRGQGATIKKARSGKSQRLERPAVWSF